MNKPDAERQMPDDLTCVWNLGNRTNRNREQIGGYQRPGWGEGALGEGGQKAHTFSPKINKSSEGNIQHGD